MFVYHYENTLMTNKESNNMYILMGALQGYSLGPTLFSLYVNDVDKSFPTSESTLNAAESSINIF